ncbi:MAG: hypothetical protein H6822_26185 [Planctomycetaceae bacterium]|nr:hypothetical protein [Planctomycetales bacterium]MCB9925667.1 hypothetical protein [Planctomycetaceae bacterium]
MSRRNFQEFVRIGIENDPVGISVSGSRASDYYDWHHRQFLEEINGIQYRVPLQGGALNPNENDYNDVGPGHIDLGNTWGPPPQDLP